MRTYTAYRRAALACLTIAFSASLWAADSAETTIKRALEQRYPKIEIEHIQPSDAMPGLYEVFTGGALVYTDRTGDHLFVGRLFETQTKRDLSAERLDVYLGVNFKSLPFDRAIKIVKGNGSRQLAIFEDPDCPYCQRLEKDLAAMTDLTIYVFLYPLEQTHPGATAHARAIWCAPDHASAWTEWMLAHRPPAAASCTGDPIDELQKLGKSLRINTTPTLFLSNGHRIRGLLQTGMLQKIIDSQLGTGDAAPSTASNETSRRAGS